MEPITETPRFEQSIAGSRMGPPLHRQRGLWIALAAFLVLLVAGGVWAVAHWPFTRAKILADIQHRFPGPVEIGGFHQVYFPGPGCVAEKVTIHDHVMSGGKPLVFAAKVTVRGPYSSFLTGSRRIRLQVEGLRIAVPADRSAAFQAKPQSGGNSKAEIEELRADDAELEVAMRDPQTPPLKFEIHRLLAGPLMSSKSLHFDVKLHNPRPSGEVAAQGEVGPWNAGDIGATPVSGSYVLSNADLGVFSATAGTLSSKGKFSGPLHSITVEGTTESPNFEIRKSEHTQHLMTQFRAEVNGTNGDVRLRDVAASWGRTTLLASGTIAGRPNEDGKTVDLDMVVHQGRIQDLMRMATKSNPPPLAGPVQFRGKAVLPPGKQKFIQRVIFTANFGIDDAKFNKATTQAHIDQLSAKARGDKEDEFPDRVLSDLKGRIELRNGVAHFSQTAFTVPGAAAGLQGTFNMISKEIDLYGTLHMEAKLSQATTGFKSVLLKIFDPFFKDKRRDTGSALPIRIRGTYSHPQFGTNLLHRH